MAELCRLVVPVDVNDASPNKLRKVREKMRVQKRHRETARLVWITSGKPTSDIPVTIDVIVRRGRVLDQGNVWSAMKFIIDGIFNRALTPNDSQKWLRLGRIEQQTGGKWTYAPEVEIVVTEAL